MFPNYPGGHGAYQDFVVRRMRDHYANPTELLRKGKTRRFPNLFLKTDT